MNKFSKIIATLSFVAATLMSLSASAQSDTATGTSNATVITPISVSAGNDLEFGSFAVDGSTAGTITQAGATTGGVTAASGGTTRSAATFSVSGNGSTPYTFTLPSTATLSDGASHNMTATLSFASGNASRTLSSGAETVTINGSLAVAANQTVGSYTGTYDVTVSY